MTVSYPEDPDEIDRRLAKLGADEDDDAAYEALRDREADQVDDPDAFDRMHGDEA